MISRRQFFRLMALVCLCALLLISFMSPLQARKVKKPKRIQSTDPALRMKWFGQHVEMMGKSPFKKLKWSYIGPKNVSGRCTDIAVTIPKGKKYTIYVATASGGVWKSINSGTTWKPVFDKTGVASID